MSIFNAERFRASYRMNFRKAACFCFCAAVLLSHLMSISSFSGQWVFLEDGEWHYDNGNGTFIKDCWAWIDGDNDGWGECYRFSKDGNMLYSQYTPDGYYVNDEGKWEDTNGEIQQVELLPGEVLLSTDDHIVYELENIPRDYIRMDSSSSSSSSSSRKRNKRKTPKRIKNPITNGTTVTSKSETTFQTGLSAVKPLPEG